MIPPPNDSYSKVETYLEGVEARARADQALWEKVKDDPRMGTAPKHYGWCPASLIPPRVVNPEWAECFPCGDLRVSIWLRKIRVAETVLWPERVVAYWAPCPVPECGRTHLIAFPNLTAWLSICGIPIPG